MAHLAMRQTEGSRGKEPRLQIPTPKRGAYEAHDVRGKSGITKGNALSSTTRHRLGLSMRKQHACLNAVQALTGSVWGGISRRGTKGIQNNGQAGADVRKESMVHARVSQGA